MRDCLPQTFAEALAWLPQAAIEFVSANATSEAEQSAAARGSHNRAATQTMAGICRAKSLEALSQLEPQLGLGGSGSLWGRLQQSTRKSQPRGQRFYIGSACSGPWSSLSATALVQNGPPFRAQTSAPGINFQVRDLYISKPCLVSPPPRSQPPKALWHVQWHSFIPLNAFLWMWLYEWISEAKMKKVLRPKTKKIAR